MPRHRTTVDFLLRACNSLGQLPFRRTAVVVIYRSPNDLYFFFVAPPFSFIIMLPKSPMDVSLEILKSSYPAATVPTTVTFAQPLMAVKP